MHPRKAYCWLLVLCFATASTLFLYAQGTGGRILGRVSDPTGAMLAGVNVKLVNEQTGVSQTTQTDKTGYYEFPTVPVGSYDLQYEQSGFKKAIKKGITLLVNQVITMNMSMQVGGAQEVVEVTSEAPLVDTTSTQLGAVVNDRSMTQLPLNSRDTYQFLQLQPGVQSQMGNPLIYGSDQAGAVSVNGGRGRANNFSVNGGDANDAFVNLPTVQPSPDSILEFRVLTNTFDAEYGRNSGSVVNVITKSGTNRYHGDVYEFFRNKVLNARNYFESTRPNFQQNQFGATFGGPIRKDQTFFFVSYEGRRIRRPTTFPVVYVPTAAERAGNFAPGGGLAGSVTDAAFGGVLESRPGCLAAINAVGGTPPDPAAITATNGVGIPYASIFPNNVIPQPCMDQTALDLMNQYVPLPNRPDGTWQGTVIGPTRGDQITGRIDHKINDHQNLTGYYYFTDDHIVQPQALFEYTGANVPGFGSIVNQRFQQYNISHTWTINSTMVNEAHFTYMREGQGDFQHPVNTGLINSVCKTVPSSQCFTDPTNSRLGITPNLGPNHEGVPFIALSGGFAIGNNSEGELPQIGNSFQWSDSLTKVKGTHTMKFGVDVRRQRFDQFLYYNVNGTFSYYGGGPNDPSYQGDANFVPNYLLGIPDQYGQGGAQIENVRSTGLYLFAQDSWKIRENLTLNYGLRWELDTPIADVGHRVQTFRPGQVTSLYPCTLQAGAAALGLTPGTGCNPGQPGGSVFPTGLVVPGDKGIPAGMTQTYYKAFAPRIGLAWSPTADSGFMGKLLGGPGKTSIRTGWGLFYNPIEQLVLEQFSAEPPFGGSSFFSNTMFNTPFLGQDGSQIPNPFNGVLQPKPGAPVDWSLFRPILLFGAFQPHMRTQYSAQYNFTIQRELRPDLVMQIGYVGSQGHRLLATHDLNYANPQTCLDLNSVLGAGTCGPYYEDSQFLVPANTIPLGFTFHLPNGQTVTGTKNGSPALNLVGLRPYSSPQCNYFTGVGCPADGVPVFSSIFAQDTIANSAYNSLQASLEKRFSHGLQFQIAYTFSKSIDQASSFEGILDPVNPRRSRSLSLFDARHRFVLSYDWQLPIPRVEGGLSKLVDGWSVSGITTFQSGFPIRILSAADNELMYSYDFELPGQPDQLAPFTTQNPKTNGGYWFNPNIFTENATDPTLPNYDPSLLGRIGTAPRTICCGPGIQNWDIALHKNIAVTEGTHMEFRAELFNAFNHTNFLNPDGNSTDGSQFGQITQARDPRLMQFALKYIF